MTEISDYSHALNIETLKNWSIGDKVKFNRGGAEALGRVSGFDLSEAGDIRLTVYDLYNREEIFSSPKYLQKL